jgi:flagellar biosynthetic protein FliR
MTEAYFLKAVGLFLIALVRFSGFFINTPVFGESALPMRIKAGLSAMCALIVLPHLIATQELPQLSTIGYGLMAVKELILGFSIGFVVLIVMDALKFAGQIIGMQIGFSFVQVADPNSNRSLGIVAEFFQLAGTLTFLIIGGHLMILQAFYQSFDIVPLAGLKIPGGIVAEMITYTGMIFVVGLQIAMPIVGVILVGDVGLGIIARTVPKMNVFQIGFALKILGGLTIITVLLPYLGDMIEDLLKLSIGRIDLLLNHMH